MFFCEHHVKQIMSQALWGLVHLLHSVFIAAYAFIVPKHSIWDFLYVIWHILINLHWTYLNGECIVTYMHKKMLDPSYQPGQASVEMSDMAVALNKDVVQQVVAICVMFTGVSLYIVMKRNAYKPTCIVLPLVIAFYTYLLLLRIPNVMYFSIWQEVYKLFLITSILFFVYSNYK
jgi:hypothetical protein